MAKKKQPPGLVQAEKVVGKMFKAVNEMIPKDCTMIIQLLGHKPEDQYWQVLTSSNGRVPKPIKNYIEHLRETVQS